MLSIVTARLTSLILSAAYKDNGRGLLILVKQPSNDGATPPFWPEIGEEIWCTQPSITQAVSSYSRISQINHTMDQVTNKRIVEPTTQSFLPKSSGFTVDNRDLTGAPRTNVVAEGEVGQMMLAGRIPSYAEFFGGSPPATFRHVILKAEAEAFLASMSTKIPQPISARQFFTPVPKSFGLLPRLNSFGPIPGTEERSRGSRDADTKIQDNPFGRIESPSDHEIGSQSNCWESVCCIGLDVERKVLTAIVEIKQKTGYGGTLCDSDSFESVGFWLIEPSRTEMQPNDWIDNPRGNMNTASPIGPCAGSVRFIGSTSFPISDIERNVMQTPIVCRDPALRYVESPLHYSVSVPLSDDDLAFMKKCSDDSARLPVLHAVLGFNVEISNENYGGNRIKFGDWQSRVVQFPVLPSAPARRLTVVGIRNSQCPTILFSSIVRHNIDTLVVQVSGDLKKDFEAAGEMTILAVSDLILPQLDRDTTILSNFITARVTYTIGEVLPDGTLEPFVLPIGNWLICAVFGPTGQDVLWFNKRDTILTGIGPSYATSCVGRVEDFQVEGIEMAGPELVSLGRPSFRKEFDTSFYNFEDCLPKEPLLLLDNAVERNVILFYPVNSNNDLTPANHAKISEHSPIVVLNYANGTIPDNEPRWTDYLSVIKQFVMQGAVVAIPWPKPRLSSFFLVDIFNLLIQTIEEVLPKQGGCPIFLFGHSMGAFQVARALEEGNIEDALRKRISGAVILAGNLFGGVSIKDIPVLLIQGGMDPQVPFTQYLCSEGDRKGDYSNFLVSSVTAFENSQTPMSVLLLVETGTHMRWINTRQDDISTTAEWNNDTLDGVTVLDGADEAYGAYPSNQAIFNSYLTYFFRSMTLGDSNLTQFFLNKTILPPDIVFLNESAEVYKQLHLYSKGRPLQSINKLAVTGKKTTQAYGYRSIGVRRTVANDDGQLSVDQLILDSTLDLLNDTTFPLMNQELVVAVGTNVRFSFRFFGELQVHDTDVIVADFTVLNPDGSLYKESLSLVFILVLAGGHEIELDIIKLLGISRDIIQPPYLPPGRPRQREVHGDLSTVECIKIPAKWLFQACLSSDIALKDSAIKEIKFVCKSLRGNPIKFGLGRVEIMSLDEWEIS